MSNVYRPPAYHQQLAQQQAIQGRAQQQWDPQTGYYYYPSAYDTRPQ